MDIQLIGRSAYLITVPADELGKRVTDFTDTDAEKMCRRALTSKELEHVCVEVYPGRDELMIFVRKGCEHSEVYSFDNFEDILRAVRLTGKLCDSRLVLYGERYILTLTPWDGDPVPPGICEFGKKLAVSDMMLAHILEHGRMLISSGASDTLKALLH